VECIRQQKDQEAVSELVHVRVYNTCLGMLHVVVVDTFYIFLMMVGSRPIDEDDGGVHFKVPDHSPISDS